MPNNGKSATVSTTIPIPPSQWVSERHSRMDCGRTSMSINTDAPVVENPDMTSKKASGMRGMAPERIMGAVPAAVESNHPRTTKR
jgi:hypothetical protein